MAKFSGSRFTTPTPTPDALTHEGAPGYTRTPRQELFVQAVNEMAEDTYYESAESRQDRLASNVATVVAEPGGWQWLGDFLRWLRADAGMRSASVMVAAEAIAAAKSRPSQEAGPSPRQLVSLACLRPDEPAELLGYWLQNKGRKIPAALKRGLADSAARLYSERNALKYDGQSRSVRMGDVIDLTHPVPSTPEQSALFRYLIDRRHNRDEFDFRLLPVAALDRQLLALPEGERAAAFEQGLTAEAGWSWERVAGWLPGGLTSEVWERLIPTMGYMALVRNLRNFDQAGISPAAKKFVAEKLADPDEVARSRQFPYRFLSAWKATESVTWASALETALGFSVRNIPELPGRTLVLVDTSGSMQSPVGGARSQAMRYEVAALFGAALALRNKGVDLHVYATDVEPWPLSGGASVLRSVEQMREELGRVGHGTNTWGAIQQTYTGHDRVVVLTDEQSHDFGTNPGTMMHFINLAGYRVGTAPQDSRTFAYGGFTDAMFGLLPLLERGAKGLWPWQ